jgi:hypothetical protein
MKFLLPIFIFFFCFSATSHGQLSDDFSDGDLSNDPSWLGQTDLFTVNAGELQLFDQMPGSSNTSTLYLPAPTSLDAATTWQFLVRLDFSPSASNYARVYLASSSSDLNGPLDGYFVRVGGISGSDDALELVRQDGTSETILLSGTSGAVGGDPAIARVEVTRTVDGTWSLAADYSGGTDFVLEGTATDATYSFGDYFGLVCFYTSTRAESFFFDDFLIDPLFTDTEGPLLLMAAADDPNAVFLSFNEPLDPATAEVPANYEVNVGIGQPFEATLVPGDPSQVVLLLPAPLEDQNTYEVTATGITDVLGNSSGPQSVLFTFLNLQEGLPYEVLINEIFADPSPAIGLPEVEFVELYNRSGKTIDLEGWTFSDGGSPAVFPAAIIPPGGFLILTEAGEESLLAPYGQVLGLEGFPGLNNGGDDLVVTNIFGETIHAVSYSSEWYRESDKDDGGWTLEMINPLQPCAGGTNWRASENLLGGTPGSANSILTEVIDEEGPVLDRIFPETPGQGRLTFSEDVAASIASDLTQYQMEGVSITSATVDPIRQEEVVLTWSPDLVPGDLYTLEVKAGMADCQLNENMEVQTIDFGLPAKPEPGDVVINELLYLPEVGGDDFVELYNQSGKLLNLNDLILGNIQGSSDSIAPVDVDFLFFPGTYVVLTESPADIRGRYEVPRPEWLVMSDLPTFSSPAGNVTVYAEVQPGVPEVIDAFDYSDELHNELLDETRGVSLERINPMGESEDAGNWHSAAATAGYATPTGPNSQLQQLAESPENAFQLVNDRFSPDNDGYEDVLLLQYALDQPGYVSNIKVFDAYGRWTADLAQNLVLGSEGQLKWDGQDGNGQRARLGIYVIWIELFHPDGTVRQEKHSCVLAGQLD